MAKILVVEDDESMNEILVRTLTDQGFEVGSAFNTAEAIALCRTENYDLLITDVRLPGRDGVDGLSTIKQLQPNIKCIVITGYASANTPARAIKLRVDDYLLKPFKLKSFLGSIDRVLDPSGQIESRRELLCALLPSINPNPGEEVARLIETREQTLRGLYVGTRAEFLTHQAALEVYIKLEMLEESFRKLLMSADPVRTEVLRIRVQYAAISDRIESFHIGNAEDPDESIVSVPTAVFTVLFDKIKKSEVGLNDLDYAPLLRRISDTKLEKFPELLELKRLLWP